MKTEDIRTLVDRFMDGETTTQEERALYEAFCKGAYPPELEDMRPFFADLAATLAPVDARPARPMRRHRVVRWAIGIAAAVIVCLMLGTWMWTSHKAAVLSSPIAKTGETPSDEQDDPLLAQLLAPTAEDSLRQAMDHEIDLLLAQTACQEGDFVCRFDNHSRLLLRNHDPQYVNNVLGRMLTLCQRSAALPTNATDRQQCIGALKTFSTELQADPQCTNNLGIGLCMQCIRALGGEA